MCIKISIDSILVLVSILKNAYSLVEYSKLVKAPEETPRVDISYILNPLRPTIVVLCRDRVETLSLKIICPVFKDVRGDEIDKFDHLIVDDKCSRSKKDNWSRCSQVVRTISWKGIELPKHLNCSCLTRKEGLENNINKASVDIVNHERKVKKNTVLRKKVNKNKNIRLHCYITGHPTPEITWYRDNILLNRNRSTINNVRYQQKNDSLVISRSDVRGSGNYQCFARNNAGEAGGEIYQVEFFETKSNVSDRPELQKGIIKYNITGEKFIETNETVDNKEEEEEVEEETNKEENRGKNRSVKLVLFTLCGTMFVLVVIPGVILLFVKRKKYLSDGNAMSSTVTECSDRTKSDCKLIVALGEISQQTRCQEDEQCLYVFKKSYSKKCQNTGSFSEIQFQSLDYRLKSDVLHSDFLCVSSTLSQEICKLDQGSEELLANTPGQYAPLPLLESESYCSSSFEDLNVFPDDHFTHSPARLLTHSELNVDTTSNDICVAPTTISGNWVGMPSPNSSTNSETSALMDKLITIPPNADQRYFVSALIDYNGGEVILADTGIKLIIPERALDVGVTEAVYLALVNNSEYIPKDLNNGESLLSPVVLCGPHGLRFRKHVLLILPHSVAVTDYTERKFRVLCSDTSPEVAPDWKEVFNYNEKPNKEMFCYMGREHFSLFVLHFTWYAIPGEGDVKNFSLAAYHTMFHQPNEEFKVRLHFIPILPKSNLCQQKVEQTESKLQGRLSDAPKVKIFHKDGGDIKIEACEISEGWELIGEDIQTEGYNELCNCHEESPNRTYRLKHIIPRPDGVSCKLRICQEKCDFDTPVDIIVSLNFEAEIKRAQYQNNNYRTPSQCPSVTASSSGYAGSGESAATRFIPTRLRKDLIQLLDREIVGRSNWKMLAHELDYDLQFIQWLDSGRFYSPTERLLMEWENDTAASPAEALCSLEKILLKIERVDAALKIKECLEKLVVRKETTV